MALSSMFYQVILITDAYEMRVVLMHIKEIIVAIVL